MDEVDDVLADQLEYHLDKRLNSLRFLRRMRGEGRAEALPSTADPADRGSRPPSKRVAT
jgi:hypothetical protein